MANEGSSDPFSQWRAWFDRSERELNAAFNQLMSTEEFKESQGKTMSAFLDFQRAMGERSQEFLSLANMPSRADIVAITERLDRIDERLAGIEAQVGSDETAPPPVAKRARPKRTRKPPTLKKAAAKKASAAK